MVHDCRVVTDDGLADRRPFSLAVLVGYEVRLELTEHQTAMKQMVNVGGVKRRAKGTPYGRRKGTPFSLSSSGEARSPQLAQRVAAG